ncbi:hypothetical protein ACIRLA_21780 [Streptomyces sp. NPDC102364]|uniref:hypothetical protein n=1 Tax=Streptomyces sp. NPDC102364 TaxID=3366161 RepID=UPI003808EE33
MAERTNLPFDYLSRLLAVEDFDPQDPGGNATLAKQLTIVFDHHVAKCFASPDPISALHQAGFTEVADALAATLAA